MKATSLALFSLLTFALVLPNAKASSSNQNPFKDCWVESGPQLRENALQIPDELLQENWRKLNDLSKGQANTSTYFRLNYDENTRMLSIGGDQSFEDMAQNDSEVIVQIGGSYWRGDGKIYGTIETKFGKSYTNASPYPTGNRLVQTAEINLQYVSFGEGKYRDIRLHCTYLE